jgi:hypothetical protein
MVFGAEPLHQMLAMQGQLIKARGHRLQMALRDFGRSAALGWSNYLTGEVGSSSWTLPVHAVPSHQRSAACFHGSAYHPALTVSTGSSHSTDWPGAAVVGCGAD